MRSFVAFLLALSLCVLPACGDKHTGGTAATNGGGSAASGSPADASGTATPDIGTGGVRASGNTGIDDSLRERMRKAGEAGRAFLLTQQDEKGAFGDAAMKIPGNVAFSAMAVSGLVGTTAPTQVESDAAIRKGLEFIVGFQQEDGAIFDNPKWANYCTSACVSALAAAKVGDFRKVQSKAGAYLASSQITGDPKDMSYGGFPYKSEQSADASNALMATNALEADGLAKDSEVRARVGTFVSKLQNRSESNQGERVIEVDGEKRIVVAGEDGGGFYRPDESKAGMVKRSDGKWELRSYGSMTYAVLKLMLFAGVPADDPRVKGLVNWIATNWTVERNPGFEGSDDPDKLGQQGMFYYLYTATRALAAYEEAAGRPLIVKSSDGRSHNWRAAIAEELLKRQGDDGSWRNEVVDRWEEGSKTLCTGFALQTLAYLTGRFR